MWKEVFGGTSKLLTLSNDVQQNKTDIKELRQDVKDLRREMKEMQDAMRRLTSVVEGLSRDVQESRREAAHDRETFLLQLRVAFLEFEKRLPSVSTSKNE